VGLFSLGLPKKIYYFLELSNVPTAFYIKRVPRRKYLPMKINPKLCRKFCVISFDNLIYVLKFIYSEKATKI
jgi:hypothetical protein